MWNSKTGASQLSQWCHVKILAKQTSIEISRNKNLFFYLLLVSSSMAFCPLRYVHAAFTLAACSYTSGWASSSSRYMVKPSSLLRPYE